MASKDSNNCDLPSKTYYNKFDIVHTTGTYESFCNTYESTLNKYPGLHEFCLKLVSNLGNLKKDETLDMTKHCTYLNFWKQENVINIVQGNSSITYIILFYTIWNEFIEKHNNSIKDKCSPKYFSSISVDYRKKWQKMNDYNNNYEYLKNGINNNENCKEHYCKYFADIINIHKEFQHVCNVGTNKLRCPDFWGDFHKYYSENSHIEALCEKIYEELGLYKVKVSFGDPGEEIYIEQYETTYIFSFFEKMIGYSIKKYLSKSLYYFKLVVAPIVLILLFYFFMKKLSLFGSKIIPRVDNLRKMWRNVQGVTNPATLLHPPKPPLGGNKMGLPYMPK
ncbi:PIR Superfamily Protein [Plasmodium ovale wallikeri]|uniref:PIR Superfamily Protein n=2 Tax=Plasmodium ovale TaxID=36330 RepID=A0A1A9AF25_PLAOA|nr:PIR Superfamily Protein [Plasmodium ovale wallikeri]SBT57919.1 PIR Superfamily Protein [Plasmodium ovale wallikeri]SBT74181.1 Plasmodium vivax Vir protein, putative [Plasmodium ovale]